MPRRRFLSPEFFKDEDLATLPYEARLLFQGLWCYADREGRLKDRPKYLKAELFPYDRVDIDRLLTLLSNPQIAGRSRKVFIRRYQVDGQQLIDIPEFSHHQSPHRHEPDSTLPAFVGTTTDIVRLTTDIGDTSTDTLSLAIDKGERTKDKGQRTKDKRVQPPKKEHLLPEGFAISSEVTAWAEKKGYTRLPEHLDWFVDWATAKGKTYVDWDAAFKNAIRGNWAKLEPSLLDQVGEFDHLPRIDFPCWLCGCKTDGSEACRLPSHGMTREQYDAWRDKQRDKAGVAI